MDPAIADSAPRRVFQRPQLIAQILEHLAFPRLKQVLAAAQVNSLWADQVTNIVWRQPPYTALVALANDARRQYYARKVRVLTLTDAAADRHALNASSSCLARVTLPRLQLLELDADAVLRDEWGLATLSNLLVPVTPLPRHDADQNSHRSRGIAAATAAAASSSSQLERFRFRGRAQWLMDVLELLRTARAPLTELTLDCAATGRSSPVPDTTLFLGMLEALSSSSWRKLASASFNGSVALAVAVPALIHLARLPDLARLAIDRCVRAAEVQNMLTGAATLTHGPGAPVLSVFPSLQQLTLGLESAAVPLLLLPHLPRLRDLALYLHDEQPLPDLVLSAIGAYTRGLCSLQVLVRADEYVPIKNWLAVTSLTELRALKVAPLPAPRARRQRKRRRYHDMGLLSPALGGSMLAAVVFAVGRHLRELVLWLFAGRLTVAALRVVGEYCPVLERLELAGRYDLQQLGAQGPRLFPRLRVLRLAGAAHGHVR